MTTMPRRQGPTYEIHLDHDNFKKITSPLGDKILPWGIISPLEVKVWPYERSYEWASVDFD
jgi:hypothetical protein